MIYITGDTHGRFSRLEDFCKKFHTTKEDTMIILGDVGINYFNNKSDEKHKKELRLLPIKFFCIHGNHEIRPQNLPEYKETTFWNGKVFIQDEYPDIIFAKDGEIYDIPTMTGIKKTLVCGGAYSIDKYYRIGRYMLEYSNEYPCDMVTALLEYTNSRYDCPEFAKARKWADKIAKEKNLYNKCGWWDDEQPSEESKDAVKRNLDAINWKVDIVLTHTCPLKHEPIESFIPGINQSGIDKSTECFLDTIENKLKYSKWFCGHYHIEKNLPEIQFLFSGYDSLD